MMIHRGQEGCGGGKEDSPQPSYHSVLCGHLAFGGQAGLLLQPFEAIENRAQFLTHRGGESRTMSLTGSGLTSGSCGSPTRKQRRSVMSCYLQRGLAWLVEPGLEERV